VYVGLALCSACTSYGLHLTPTPLPERAQQLGVAFDALVIDRGFGPQWVPNPEFAWRRGVGHGVDLGGRINAGGVEANLRWRLLRQERFTLAAVPGMSFGFVPVTNADTGLFNASALAALLAGMELESRWQLVLGARGAATYAFPLTAFQGEAAGAKMIYLAGGVLGLRCPVGESTFLFPDINVLVPYDSERQQWYFPNIQGGVSLEWE
jgi:hypothetical protein